MSLGSAPPPSPTTAAESGAGFESLFRVFAGLRSDAESRFRRQLDKISNAEKILANLVTSVDRSTIEVVVTVGRKKSRPRKPVSDLAVVERAASSFGEDSFTLDDLTARVAQLSPEQNLARQTISRRLHDLKQKGIISATRKDSTSAPRRRSYFAYRRRVAPHCGTLHPPVP